MEIQWTFSIVDTIETLPSALYCEVLAPNLEVDLYTFLCLAGHGTAGSPL